ncbi:unnamed protein product [Leuciscus chuanchicus]
MASASSSSRDSNLATAEASFEEHLAELYVQTKEDSDGKKLTFLCKLCPPGLNKQVRTSATSSSNLKRHIELRHPSYLGKYLRLTDERKKSLTKRGPPPSTPTQVKLTAFSKGPAVSFVSQQQVDKLVLDYIVGDLQPLKDFPTADKDPDPDVDSDNAATENENEPGSTSPPAVDEEDDMEPEPLSALEDPRLPPHRRCMAHTLNLVAKDTEKVTDKQYKTLSRAIFAKASALWNRIKRSPKASDFIEGKLGIGFVFPNDTRWNSLYLAMKRLSHIATLIPQADTNEAADTVTLAYDNLILHAVCDEFGFRRFSAEEISFIHKFVDVMRPLASALNILQGEKNVFLGYLAPTIVQLQNDMNGLLEESTKPTAAQGLITCRPLILNILQSLKTRVEAMLEKKEHILSAMLLPIFKLNWVEDEEKRLLYRVMLKRELLTSNSDDSETQNSDQSQPSGDTDKDTTASFFRFNQNPQNLKKNEADTYLDAPTTDGFAEYMLLPRLKKLFLKYNTALPSSAPVERLFSIGGQIFRPRRNRLGDENFEKQLLLNANRKLKEV